MGGNCDYEGLGWDWFVGGYALDSVDVGWDGKVGMDLATFLDHPFAKG